MMRDPDSFLAADFPDALRKIRERTPARIFSGRAGAAYRTSTQLELREAHAAARDAVREELDMPTLFGEAFVKKWNLFEVRTEARSKEEYLAAARPGPPLKRIVAPGISHSLFARERHTNRYR